MKRLIPLLFLATTASASFSGYTYQRTITISHTQVSTFTATYSNIPVLVSTNDVAVSTNVVGGHLSNSNDFDLIFSTMNDCSFLLNWDTETVNNTGISTMTVWVNIPSISSTTDTIFYMCYGNAATTTYLGHSTATWDSNFKGVYHLPNGATLGLLDSTSNGNTMTNSGITATSGQIDGAGNSSGGTNNLSNSGTTVAAASNITMEAWVNPTASGIFQTMVGKQNGGTRDFDMYLDPSVAQIDMDLNGNFSFISISPSWTIGAWNKVVATADGTTWKIFLNGKLAGSTASATLTGSTAGASFEVFTDQQTNTFTGSEDEIRVSNVARSSGTIQTEYNNEKSPSTFYTYGAESTGATLPPGANRGLLIQGGKVTIIGGRITVQ